MSSIDERVVEMKFDTSLFQRGVQVTLDGLNKLKQGLQMQGSTKGLDDLEKKTNQMSFKGIESGLQGVTDKFKAMSVVGIAALASITQKAVDAGLNMTKSMAIQPITDGFNEYELKMSSIQTILANTARDGTKLSQVSGALDQLNHYADKTIYNFGDMTKNIGLFTNAGIKLQPAVDMIKGFSNEAAASGTSAQGAASAAYQLSQALSSGKITLMDWKSLTNVGMGNKLMQTDIISIADAMGTLKDKGVKAKDIQKDFNKSLEKGWLTADVMSKYLQIMSKDYGDMTAKQVEGEKAQLRKLGLDDKEINALIAKAKTAQDAATKVRTATQLFGTLKEAVGSGWSQTFELILGNFDEATASFTRFSKILGSAADASSKARNKVLTDWKKAGGMTALADSLVAGFEALQAAMKPVKDAFREIFPPMTGVQLANMTKSLRDFLQQLKMGPATAAKVKAIFKGLFAAFDIGFTILKKVGQMFLDLFRGATQGSGALADIAIKIANWLVGVDKALKQGRGLNEFFRQLTAVLMTPIQFLKEIPGILKGIFSGGMNSDAVTSAFDRIGKRAEPIRKLFGGIGDMWDSLKKKLAGAGAFFAPLAQGVYDLMQRLKTALTSSFTTGDFSGVLDAINTGLFGGLVLIFKKFMSNGINVDLGGGFLGKIGQAFDGLTGTLKSMQQQVKAETIQKIAIAVGILTASIVVLSLIDSAKLAQATGAVVGLFTGLVVAMKMLDQVSSIKGALKLPALALGMTGLAVALLILSAAVKNMASLDWGSLIKGLTGTMVLLGSIAGMMQLMPNNNSKMISAGLGMIAIAAAIKILVSATKDMASMDWGSMAKGLTGVSAMLAALGIFARFSEVNKMGLSNGVGLILLAASLKIMYSAVKDFSGMDWGSMGKGLLGMAGALSIVAAAMNLMPMNMAVSAGSLVVVAAALLILSNVMQSMGGMSWDEIAHGMVTLAGSLGIIAAAMYLMAAALPGAAALLVVSAALAILAPILQTLGGMDIQTIATALGVLAGVFALLGVAGLVLAPVVPVLMGLGVAIVLLGAGAALAGVGMMAFAAGLTALSIAGTAGAAALTAIVAAIIGLIPLALTAFGQGLVALAAVIAGAGPTFVAAMTTLMMSLLQAINNVVPTVISTIINLISTILNAIASNIGNFISLGMRIIVGFLNGIASQIGNVVNAAVNLIVALLNGIARNIGRVIDAGVNLIRKFLEGVSRAVPDVVNAGMKMITDILNGVATAIRNNSGPMNAAGRNVASAIVDGLVNGLSDMGGAIVAKARSLASDALGAFKHIFDIHSPSREMYKIGQFVVQGFVKGLDGNKDSINKSFESLKTQLTDMRKHAEAEVAKQQKALTKLNQARRKDRKKIAQTSAALAQARKEVTQSSNAYNNLTKNWTDDKNKMGQLADQYDALGTKLKDANQKLADATKLRDDYATSVKDQYNDVPAITGETKLQNFANDIRKKIEDNKTMLNKMTELRKLGLSDTMYKELMAKGTDALPFINELVGTGKSGVTQINQLSTDLEASAHAMGVGAATALYQAGVDSARGIIKGLQSQQTALENQMDVIAAAMVRSIKKSLGIKSPAREMMPVGEFAVKGVAKGLEQHAHLVEEASKQVGMDAINAMRKTIVGLDDVVNGGVDMQPVIRPILDLTDIQNKAGVMDAMFANKGVSATATYGQARGALAGYTENQQGYSVEVAPVASKQVSFVQNNYSPKALSAADVYRNTNNQLSKLKGALGN